MKTLTVCMGSACHLKDALAVVQVFRDAIEEHGLGSEVELRGSFCLGNCGGAVMVQFEDTLFPGVRARNAAEVFREAVVPKCRPVSDAR